jgi:phosphomannomutase
MINIPVLIFCPSMKISISGIRGIYGSDLNLHEIGKFTRLFASSMIKLDGECVISRDTRPSSRIIAEFVSANLMKEGIDVYNLHVAPTPIAFRESRKYKGGLVITASHNPLEWNGLKFIINGRGLFENELDFMLRGKDASRPDKFGKSFDIVSNYEDEVLDLIPKQDKNNAIFGLDLGGGAACGYSNQLFGKLGKKIYSINDIYGMSSRGPDPTTDDLMQLRKLVVSNHLDLGFAFDLDGDRLVVINKKGEKLGVDATLLICIASSINLGMKKFVASIDTSLSVEKYVVENGGRLYYSKVGEANVVNKMLKVDADAGGEGSSAGFIMPKFNMCRDGLLSSAIISSNIEVIEKCLGFSSQYNQIRSKIFTDSPIQTKLIDKLGDILKVESSEVLTMDGLKAIVDDDSWILIRPSNTENAIRISVESKISRVQSLYKETIERVQQVYDQVK